MGCLPRAWGGPGFQGKASRPGSDRAQTDIANVLWSALGYGKYRMTWQSREGVTSRLGAWVESTGKLGKRPRPSRVFRNECLSVRWRKGGSGWVFPAGPELALGHLCEDQTKVQPMPVSLLSRAWPRS